MILKKCKENKLHSAVYNINDRIILNYFCTQYTTYTFAHDAYVFTLYTFLNEITRFRHGRYIFLPAIAKCILYSHFPSTFKGSSVGCSKLSPCLRKYKSSKHTQHIRLRNGTHAQKRPVRAEQWSAGRPRFESIAGLIVFITMSSRPPGPFSSNVRVASPV